MNKPTPTSEIIIRCNKTERLGVPCIHEDCAKCAILLTVLEDTCFEPVREIQEAQS